MSSSRPTERTYEPGDGALDGLSRLPGVRDVLEAPAVPEEATFFDTAGLSLASAGVSLIRQEAGADPGWALALPSRRRQDVLRAPLTAARRLPPKPLRAAATAWTLGDELGVAAVVASTGTTYELVGAENVVLATVSVRERVCDLVADGGRSVAWSDVTVEPVEAEAGLLHALDLLMDTAAARQTVRRTDGLDLLRELLPDAPALPRPRPKRAAGRVLHTRLAEQVDALRRHDVEARRDGRARVHDLRVALRRLSAALGTWGPLVDREVTDPLRDELRWAARALGASRDAEVADEILSDVLAAEPSRLVAGPVRRRVSDDLRAGHRAMREQAADVLGSDRYVDLLRGLDRLVADPPWTDVAARPAREVLPRLVRKDWNRLARRARRAEALARTEEHDTALHDVRKAAKRLRYAAEALEPVYAGEAARLARRARKLQSVLGQHHDTVVARDRLLVLTEAADRAGESAFTYGRLHQRLESRALGYERSAGRALARVPKPQL